MLSEYKLVIRYKTFIYWNYYHRCTQKYWLGQKVRSDFSQLMLQKAWTLWLIQYLLFDKDIKFWLQICKLLPISLWMNHLSTHFFNSFPDVKKSGKWECFHESQLTIIGRVQWSREVKSLAWPLEWPVFSNRPCYFTSCVDLGKTLYFSEPRFSKQ